MTHPADHIRQSMQDAMIAVNDLDDLHAAAHHVAGLSQALVALDPAMVTSPRAASTAARSATPRPAAPAPRSGNSGTPYAPSNPWSQGEPHDRRGSAGICRIDPLASRNDTRT